MDEVYYIIGGVRPGEGAIVTRDRLNTADVWRLGQGNTCPPLACLLGREQISSLRCHRLLHSLVLGNRVPRVLSRTSKCLSQHSEHVYGAMPTVGEESGSWFRLQVRGGPL